MSEPSRLTSLPENLELGLLLLERGYLLGTGENGEEVGDRGLPGKVLDFFQRLEMGGVDWVLVGAEAVNLYIQRPRATVDVDIVVRRKHLGRIRRILKDTCRDLVDAEGKLRAVLSEDPNRLEVDVIKSQSHELFDAALDQKTSIQSVPVPKIEALLALKYLSAVSAGRQPPDKHQDVADFIRAYKENVDRMDRELLVDLASRAHSKAHEEFPEFLDAVENDRPVVL